MIGSVRFHACIISRDSEPLRRLVTRQKAEFRWRNPERNTYIIRDEPRKPSPPAIKFDGPWSAEGESQS